MKTRIIQTRFWDDEFISEADIYTQHLYLFLLTSQYINICGIFQLPERKIIFEAKLTTTQFSSAKKTLESNKKGFFYKGWVCIPNALKNNNYIKSSDNQKAYERELGQVPSDVRAYFESSVDSTVESSVDSTPIGVTINHKSEIRNKKSEIDGVVKGKINLGEEDFQLIANDYKVPIAFVRSKYDDLLNYCSSKGKIYKDYKATLRNWVKSDAFKIKQDTYGKSKISVIS